MILTNILTTWLTRSFKPFEFTNKYTNNLDFEAINELGLYVHIPFCKSICSFCPYCKEIYNESTAAKYKDALIKEIDLVGSKLTNKEDIDYKKEITSLYFGGGSPALMVDDLSDIIKALEKYFIIKQGIGVELHPTDINDEVLLKLKNAGVNMISIGIQSFDDTCLSSIGRKPTDYSKIFKSIKAANFDVVDMDLIFAIPGQNENILLEDIEKAFSNGATQISTYPFIDFTFANNLYKPLSENTKKEMLKSISKYCKDTDRNRTSVWTFANHNTDKYSSVTRDNFLGFGVSATTLLKNEFKINTFSIDKYINRVNNGELPTSLTLDFTLRQRACYYLFWNSYSMKIDSKKFENYFGKSLKNMYGFELWVGQMLGLLKFDEGVYYLTDKGAYYYHYVEQAYTTAYIDKMWNISRKQAFPDKITLS